MYIKESETAYRVYWEDNHGAESTIHTSGFNVEDTVQETVEYIRKRLYMDAFSIVGVDQWVGKGWEKVPFTRIRCKGR